MSCPSRCGNVVNNEGLFCKSEFISIQNGMTVSITPGEAIIESASTLRKPARAFRVAEGGFDVITVHVVML